MKFWMRALLSLCLVAWVGSALAESYPDIEGSQDHPLLNRMPGFFINGYTVKDFDAFAFPVGNDPSDDGKKQLVEGKTYEINYNKQPDAPAVSMLKILRNFENALRTVNAVIIAKPPYDPGSSYNYMTAKVAKQGSEIWVLLTGGGDYYMLNIVEKKTMEQVIQANDMYDAIAKDGFVALDIHFDTGMATIKPESQPIVEQIARLLHDHTELKVSVEGHTDNVGTPAFNKKLSEQRAASVMAAVAKQDIAAARMSAVGWGQERPTADNRTEEGRAKNRRVEIVRK